ncbi:MAG TPA: hypothetical protein VL284_01490 [Thermoanaerobaculia bacterium]|nr:hypothetical protein [Thermoanaerobaculia bacterium]
MKRLTIVAPILLLAVSAAAQVNDTYVIPAAGNTPGAFNTTWATQFSVFNPQAYPLRVSVTFVPTPGSGNSDLVEKLITVPANSVAFSDNILSDLFNMSGQGALLVATFPEDNPSVADSVIARAFLVVTDTYNNARTGTFGQTVPGVWAGLQDFATDGISAIAHGIRNNIAFRTNVGAVNLGRTSVKMRINVYDMNGNTIQQNIPFTLPPLGHFQDALPVQVDRGSLEFFVDDSTKQAVVFPYVSVVDNGSGDPQYQSPTLLATPDVLFRKAAKVDVSFARSVRAHAERLGEGQLQTK